MIKQNVKNKRHTFNALLHIGRLTLWIDGITIFCNKINVRGMFMYKIFTIFSLAHKSRVNFSILIGRYVSKKKKQVKKLRSSSFVISFLALVIIIKPNCKVERGVGIIV